MPTKAKKTATRGAAVRESRSATQRENQEVHVVENDPWERGATLAMPPARAGMDQRWIRFAIGGKDDNANYARKRREGWSPVQADDVPKAFHVQRIEQGRFAGLVVTEGSVLCERPKAMGIRRSKHFQKETARRTNAVDADLERANKENRSPAFGAIQMAMKSKVMREVAVKDDD